MTITTRKPLGTIQVDVDDLWVYYQSIGRNAPDGARALIFEQGMPRLLELFERHSIRATFFIVGRDLPAQAASVRELIRRGHEVANHSTWHRPGFARLTREEKRADIVTTHRLIMDAAGERPVGFKSPGFSLGPDQLDVLAELGYLYDSSLLPTFYAPALRSLQRVLSGGHVDPTQYGRALNGLAPLHPYHPAGRAPYRQSGFRSGRPAPRWMKTGGARSVPPSLRDASQGGCAQTGPSSFGGYFQDRRRAGLPAPPGMKTAGSVGPSVPPGCFARRLRTDRPERLDGYFQDRYHLWEAPVTTMPVLRMPMHSTFVLSAGRPLFDLGLALVQARGVPINYLLHAADVVDGVTDPALASYRFLTQPWAEKQPLYEHILTALSERYELVPTREFVEGGGRRVEGGLIS